MRRLWRPAVHTPTLDAPTSPAFLYRQGQADGTKPRDKFEPYWRSPDVRGVLRAICGRACAYCCDLVGRTGEDVEHYRPKNLYWFVAYTTENYVSSCRRCNSSRKGNRFPLADNAVRAATAADFPAEQRMLLDPAADDIESALRVELVSKRYDWEVDPAAGADLAARATATIKFFRLNNDAELQTDRVNRIQDFLDGMLSTDANVKERTRLWASRYVPHGAALRSILRQTQPALVPTVAEEVRAHVVECVMILRAAEVSADPDPDTAELARYALATLWFKPPKGVTRKLVGAWYRDAGVADAVKPLLATLK
jgi:uncharacterized protein (TIGR02646 family)